MKKLLTLILLLSSISLLKAACNKRPECSKEPYASCKTFLVTRDFGPHGFADKEDGCVLGECSTPGSVAFTGGDSSNPTIALNCTQDVNGLNWWLDTDTLPSRSEAKFKK